MVLGQSPKVLKQEVRETEKKKFIFLDEKNKEELELPVTPESYEIDHGINREKITLTELGTTNLSGKRYMMDIKIECMFPAQSYSFCNAGARTEPYYYVRKFEGWCDEGAILRFMISGTNINTTCFIESILFKEQDGTGDVYATITVAQYRVLKTADNGVKTATGNNARTESTTSVQAEKTYKIASGDTLSGISRKFYGDSSLYRKLASYNGIKNANLIRAGSTIKIPDKGKL